MGNDIFIYGEIVKTVLVAINLGIKFVRLRACMLLRLFLWLIMYRIAGIFGGVNVWRIGRIKSIWQKKFGE